jgi:hypothetical protein
MRLSGLSLALALLALADLNPSQAAPAPLPKRDRETAIQKRERDVSECARLLGELGVKWSVLTRLGEPVVRYSVEVRQPNRSGSLSGEDGVLGADLPGALRRVIRHAGAFVRNDGPY